MRIVSFYPTRTFKLIIEFDNNEYRILDMQKFLKDEQGLLRDICNDINLFMSAELDQVAGTIRFSNDVDFDNTVLYEASYDLDSVMKCNRNIVKSKKPAKPTRLPKDYQSKISKEHEKILRILRQL